MDTNHTGQGFLYFGFGSNLMKARISLQNPTAKFHTIARLSDYRLDFDNKSSEWMGASATIRPSPGDHVWGVVWSMGASDLENLDDQEGVAHKVYEPITVEVTSATGEVLICRTYILLRTGSADRRPSPHYLDIIIKGAEEHKLPVCYIEKLRKIQHNGYGGSIPVYDRVMANYNNC